MLSEAKHLLLFEYVGDKQILRFAQNDNLCVYTIRRNALIHQPCKVGAVRPSRLLKNDQKPLPHGSLDCARDRRGSDWAC